MKHEEFGIVFALMAEYFGATPSQGLTQVYYELLKDLPIEDFKRACQTIMRGRVYAGLPKVAEIRETIEGKIEDKVALAFQSLVETMKRQGAWETIIFQDGAIANAIQGMGGWEAVNEITFDEWRYKKKEFEQLYLAHLRRGNTQPKKVFGAFDRINEANGQWGWNKPVLVTKEMGFLPYTDENLRAIGYQPQLMTTEVAKEEESEKPENQEVETNHRLKMTPISSNTTGIPNPALLQ
jgi:hypothetical protein